MRLPTFFLITTSLACASAPHGAPDQTSFFEGTSSITLPGGRVVPGGAVLARRTMSPTAGTIVEQVISSDARPNRPAQEYLVMMQVTIASGAAHLTMRESQGGFDGDGTLDGEPWKWTSWRTMSRLPNGTRVESIDSLVGTELIAHKRVFAPDGSVSVSTVERLHPIDAARFGARRAELLLSK